MIGSKDNAEICYSIKSIILIMSEVKTDITLVSFQNLLIPFSYIYERETRIKGVTKIYICILYTNLSHYKYGHKTIFDTLHNRSTKLLKNCRCRTTDVKGNHNFIS